MTRDELQKELITEGYLHSTALIEAFGIVDRIHFVPANRKDEAYGNYPLPIGHGQTISQPLTVAFMLELLEPKAGDSVLEIGAGSGWQTALLSVLVGGTVGEAQKSGKVVAIERHAELAALAERNIAAADIPTRKNIHFMVNDGTKGALTEGPFDRVIAAAAAERIPDAWKEQVKIGGCIVAPLRESIVVLKKTTHDTFETKQYFGFSFVPLIEG
jgi:protein-L-isoaspartate(D-aspartate) O-methyltransferase